MSYALLSQPSSSSFAEAVDRCRALAARIVEPGNSRLSSAFGAYLLQLDQHYNSMAFVGMNDQLHAGIFLTLAANRTVQEIPGFRWAARQPAGGGCVALDSAGLYHAIDCGAGATGNIFFLCERLSRGEQDLCPGGAVPVLGTAQDQHDGRVTPRAFAIMLVAALLAAVILLSLVVFFTIRSRRRRQAAKLYDSYVKHNSNTFFYRGTGGLVAPSSEMPRDLLQWRLTSAADDDNSSVGSFQSRPATTIDTLSDGKSLLSGLTTGSAKGSFNFHPVSGATARRRSLLGLTGTLIGAIAESSTDETASSSTTSVYSQQSTTSSSSKSNTSNSSIPSTSTSHNNNSSIQGISHRAHHKNNSSTTTNNSPNGSHGDVADHLDNCDQSTCFGDAVDARTEISSLSGSGYRSLRQNPFTTQPVAPTSHSAEDDDDHDADTVSAITSISNITASTAATATTVPDSVVFRHSGRAHSALPAREAQVHAASEIPVTNAMKLRKRSSASNMGLPPRAMRRPSPLSLENSFLQRSASMTGTHGSEVLPPMAPVDQPDEIVVDGRNSPRPSLPTVMEFSRQGMLVPQSNLQHNKVVVEQQQRISRQDRTATATVSPDNGSEQVLFRRRSHSPPVSPSRKSRSKTPESIGNLSLGAPSAWSEYDMITEPLL